MNAEHSYLDALQLDRGQRVPLHRQIYERMRSAIEQRMLQPGDRVASARALASELGVALFGQYAAIGLGPVSGVMASTPTLHDGVIQQPHPQLVYPPSHLAGKS